MSACFTVKVHPVVLFSIVDSYERRSQDSRRVIGTLLGTQEKGAVEVTNCFCVPHSESAHSDSEGEVAMDMEFAKNMRELYKKVNPQEVVVGWYATGSDVTDYSLLIHEFYAKEVNAGVTPIHVTVDTAMTEGNIKLKAYTKTVFGVPGKTSGSMFCPATVDIVGYEPEMVGVKFCQHAMSATKRIASCAPDLDMINTSSAKVEEMLEIVIGYVDQILAGQVAGDNNIGRALMEMVENIPQMEPKEFQEMLNSNMRDLLMVIYLSQLASTQLSLNEKLALF